MNAKDVTWIKRPQALQEFCDDSQGQPLAVDTESDHFHAYQARICLFQVATPKRIALIDPLQLDEGDLQPLFERFLDPNQLKILHAAQNDLGELTRDYGVSINNLFDTRVAARFLGTDKNSLSWLLENLLGVDAGPSFSRFDWSTRPLPDRATRYAAQDVAHLLTLQQRFDPLLNEQGWLDAFSQTCAHIASTTQYQPSDFDPQGWASIKGADKLDGASRTILSRLYQWRHRRCTELNRAAFLIFPDRLLASLARHQITDPQAIVDHSYATAFANKYADEIADVIVDARAYPPPPMPTKDSRRRPDPEQRQLYDALRSWRNQTARSLDIPGEYIGTNALFRSLCEEPPASKTKLADAPGILPWHVDLFGDDLMAIFQTHA